MTHRGSTVPNQPAGAFWAVLNRLFIIAQVVVLVLSELGFPAKFFNVYFPVLGKDFGLGALGLIQMLYVLHPPCLQNILLNIFSLSIGAAVLSHHVDTFTLVSAFFLFSIGCLNVFVGLIFRQGAKSKRSITSWRDHAKSAIPTHIGGVNITPYTSSVLSSPPSFISNMYTGKSASSDGIDSKGDNEKEKLASFGFGRQGEKAAGLKGFLIAKPVESLPRYMPKTSE